MRRRPQDARRARTVRRSVAVLGGAALLLSGSSAALANHSWGGYHWARTASQATVNVPLGDSVSDSGGSIWDSHLLGARDDWSRTTVLDTWVDRTGEPATTPANPVRPYIVASRTTPKRCAQVGGRVEVCNYAYGYRGWLGIASVWLSGSHITAATVKMNDSYFRTATYNTPAWRRSVMCQEVGHTFGLDHQDESGADLDTCMDYSTVPNEHPDQHDYNQLGAIYNHADATTTLAAAPATAARGTGLQRVRDDLWVEDLGNGARRVVHVRWVNRGVPHVAPVE